MKPTLIASAVIGLLAGPAIAGGHASLNFNRIASFPVVENMAAGEDRSRETSSEIIAATADGMTLVYTDSPLGVLGFIDIRNPRAPRPLGNLDLGGEPTSVAIIGQTAYVGVNTSPSYTAPSGYLAVIDIATRTKTQQCDLGGQPDSVAAAKDGSFIAIAIENERDEDLNDGQIPQMPAGNLTMFDTAANGLNCDSKRVADLTGLAAIAPSDPEPEFVDINSKGEVVVTLQENNHIAIVDRTGKVVSHFSAGQVDLTNIDATDERGALVFNETQNGRLREPDSVKWVNDDHVATANEGDYNGGSRGWTIFRKDGQVVYENGTQFEHAIVEIGHYPDKRSDAKGVEPESIEVGTFGGTPMIFVGAERASVVGVYDATNPAAPVLKQLLPSGIGPEGFVTIPERNLLISANEVDLVEDGGTRSHVMIYEYQNAPAVYPYLTSKGMSELTGWGALSGMVGADDGMIYAVNDSFYGYQPTIFKIDPNQTPARIVDAIRITRAGQPAQKLDLEGITLDGKGGFYVASEGRTDRLIPHAIYHVNAKGEIKQEIPFPAALLAEEIRFGSEGITKIGDMLWIALQREWKTDPKHHAKLVSYNLKTKEWGYVHYPKAAPATGWVGLSEITAFGNDVYIVERDNQIGTNAVTKHVYKVAQSELKPAKLGETAPVVKKTLVRDLIPDLLANNGYVLDKVEGLAVMKDGTIWISTDNDGVDDASGETMFFSIGKAQ
ncbi:MAG: esterase-like activity of phytase family protein [Gammaproteobacteria bacterium]|nr:esterase-like activity of phytase family protein [Gammaproteobacteria bacterium]